MKKELIYSFHRKIWTCINSNKKTRLKLMLMIGNEGSEKLKIEKKTKFIRLFLKKKLKRWKSVHLSQKSTERKKEDLQN